LFFPIILPFSRYGMSGDHLWPLYVTDGRWPSTEGNTPFVNLRRGQVCSVFVHTAQKRFVHVLQSWASERFFFHGGGAKCLPSGEEQYFYLGWRFSKHKLTKYAEKLGVHGCSCLSYQYFLKGGESYTCLTAAIYRSVLQKLGSGSTNPTQWLKERTLKQPGTCKLEMNKTQCGGRLGDYKKRFKE